MNTVLFVWSMGTAVKIFFGLVIGLLVMWHITKPEKARTFSYPKGLDFEKENLKTLLEKEGFDRTKIILSYRIRQYFEESGSVMEFISFLEKYGLKEKIDTPSDTFESVIIAVQNEVLQTLTAKDIDDWFIELSKQGDVREEFFQLNETFLSPIFPADWYSKTI